MDHPEKSSAEQDRSYPDKVGTLGALLRAPYERLTERLYRGLEESGFHGVRPAHSAVIRNLPEAGARVTDLAARAGITKQSMSYLVDHLVDHGYLRIGKDPGDARALQVRFTAKGRRLAGELVNRSNELEAKAATRLGADVMASLRERLVALEEVFRGE
jgi:DNA-binding MarR family transcriptional regulator